MYLNFAHLHLLLNHFPIIGTMVGFMLFLVSFLDKNENLRRSSFIVFAAVALLTIPTFLSGFGARLAIQEIPSVSDVLMQRHEGSAMLSMWFMMATGVFSLVALWQARCQSRPARWNVGVVLLLSLLTVVLMVRTGNTGADIRHPEVSAYKDGKVTEGLLGSILFAIEPSPAEFTHLMTINGWWWGFLMGLHFIGLALIVGTVGILNLRILGLLKQFTFAPLQQFIPWAMAGLGVNIVTGLLAFIGQPESYIYNEGFWLKMLALVLFGLTGAIFYLSDLSESIASLGPGEDAPVVAKLVAGTLLTLCFALIFFGRYIQPLSDTLRHTPN